MLSKKHFVRFTSKQNLICPVNIHDSTEEKDGEVKEQFYDNLERRYGILLNNKIDIYKRTWAYCRVLVTKRWSSSILNVKLYWGTLRFKSCQIIAFKDYINIMARSLTSAREMFINLERTANEVGFRINENKTNILTQTRKMTPNRHNDFKASCIRRKENLQVYIKIIRPVLCCKYKT